MRRDVSHLLCLGQHLFLISLSVVLIIQSPDFERKESMLTRDNMFFTVIVFLLLGIPAVASRCEEATCVECFDQVECLPARDLHGGFLCVESASLDDVEISGLIYSAEECEEFSLTKVVPTTAVVVPAGRIPPRIAPGPRKEQVTKDTCRPTDAGRCPPKVACPSVPSCPTIIPISRCPVQSCPKVPACPAVERCPRCRDCLPCPEMKPILCPGPIPCPKPAPQRCPVTRPPARCAEPIPCPRPPPCMDCPAVVVCPDVPTPTPCPPVRTPQCPEPTRCPVTTPARCAEPIPCPRLPPCAVCPAAVSCPELVSSRSTSPTALPPVAPALPTSSDATGNVTMRCPKETAGQQYTRGLCRQAVLYRRARRQKMVPSGHHRWNVDNPMFYAPECRKINSDRRFCIKAAN